MTKLLNRRRSRPRDLPPNLAGGLIFLSVLIFAFALILLNVGPLAAVAAFITAVVAAATGAMLMIRNGRAHPGEGTVAAGGAATSPLPPAVKLPPPGTMGPVPTAICSVLARVAMVAALTATTIIAVYAADPTVVSPPPSVEEPPASASHDSAES